MPQSFKFEHAGAVLCAEPLSDATGPLRLVFLHGWGQSREEIRPLASALADLGEIWIADLPGHGEAPTPPEAFSPAHYARLVHAWLATLPPCRTLVIGHSLGFRVAVHMAAQAATPLEGLVSLAGAGIPRPLSPRENARRRAIRLALAFARAARPILGGHLLTILRQRYGSADYNNVSPALRPTFLAVVNDDVTPLCPQVHTPALLLYGSDDTETPPAMGERFARLLPVARLHILPHQTHQSLLGPGRHVVEPLVRAFAQALLAAHAR